MSPRSGRVPRAARPPAGNPTSPRPAGGPTVASSPGLAAPSGGEATTFLRPKGPCPTCGHHQVDVAECRCGHSVAYHQIDRGPGRSWPCDRCTCAHFDEAEEVAD